MTSKPSRIESFEKHKSAALELDEDHLENFRVIALCGAVSRPELMRDACSRKTLSGR